MDSYGGGYASLYSNDAKLDSGFEVDADVKEEAAGTREFVVRARGLPWSVTDDQIAEFFERKLKLPSNIRVRILIACCGCSWNNVADEAANSQARVQR